MKKRLLSILLSALLISSSALPSAFALSLSAQLDFENLEIGSSVASYSFTDTDGTLAAIGKTAAGTTVMVKNSDSLVPENPDSNKFVKFDYNGNTGSETASNVTVTPASSIKEDFIFQFDYALDCSNGGSGNYSAANNSLMYITIMPDIQNDTSNMWKYGTKAVVIDQALNIKTPAKPTSSIAPSISAGCTKIGANERGNGFATMKVETRFKDGDYPVYDIYVKYPGDSEFTVLTTDRQYATVGYGNASLPADVYNDYGIKYITVTISAGDDKVAQVAENVFDVAIDNLTLRAPDSINLSPIYSDGMVVPKNSQFKIIGNGLSEGSRISASIYNSSDRQVMSTTAESEKDTSFELIFDDTSLLSEDDMYYIEIKSGTLSKRINYVLCGRVVAFVGGEGYAEETDNISMVFKDGIWYNPGDYTGLDYERTVGGNMSGIIVGEDEVSKLPANYIVYTVTDQNFDDNELSDFVEPLIAGGKKIVFRGALENGKLSAEEAFELENRLNNLSKKYYGDVLFVPASDGGDYAGRMADVLNDAESLFNYWDINVNGNNVYLTLSGIPESVDAACFTGEDINGNIYPAEAATVEGKTICLTFKNEEAITRLMHGRNPEKDFVYSKGNMPLPRFAAEFTAKEKYDFKNLYDREKFVSLFEGNNAQITKSSDGDLIISKKANGVFGVERKNLYYSADSVEIKLGLGDSEEIRLTSGDSVIFEGRVSKEDTILLKRIDDKLFVNDRELSEDISVIENLKLEFLNCSEAVLKNLEISMPEYGRILELISVINNLPKASEVKYADKADVQSAYEKYMLLGGENVLYFTPEQTSKMKELKAVLERYTLSEQKMKDNVFAEADIPAEYSAGKAKQKLTVGNKNNDVPYDVICVVAVYSEEGKLIDISSESINLQPGETYDVSLQFDTSNAKSVDIYVLNNIFEGYMLYKAVDVPVK